jgi:ketosteroid isomerase-like protein
MATRTERLEDAFAALDRGDAGEFKALFRPDAQWRGVEGMGYNGATSL